MWKRISSSPAGKLLHSVLTCTPVLKSLQYLLPLDIPAVAGSIAAILYYSALAAMSKSNPVAISSLGKRLRRYRLQRMPCHHLRSIRKSGLAKEDASH